MAVKSVYDPTTNTTTTQFVADATDTTPLTPAQTPTVQSMTESTNQLLGGNYFDTKTGKQITPFQPTTTPAITSENLAQTPTPQIPQPTAQTEQGIVIASAQADAKRFQEQLAAQLKEQENRARIEKEQTQRQIDELTQLQQAGVLSNIESLTQPFRQQLETSERQRLYVDENFQANQKLTNELESLLTQGNEIIKQQKAEGGLASVAIPRLNQTMEDINARAGVIQAVMSARNGQISQAYNLIDRSVNAINADRQDRLNYFKALYSFYSDEKTVKQNKLLALTNEEKAYAQKQISLIEDQMKTAQANAEKLKEAMTNPNTALAYAEAGVSLNDTPEQINQKLAKYAKTKELTDKANEMTKQGFKPLTGVAPLGAETRSFTDSNGVVHQYYKPVINPPTNAKGAVDKSLMTPAQLKDFEINTQRKVDEIKSLLISSGLDSRVGPSMATRKMYAIKDAYGAGQAFAGSIKSLLGTLTLDKLISAKGSGATFGALSEGELALLASSASKLNAWEIWQKDGKEVPYGTEGAVGIGEWNVSEDVFKEELQKIIDWAREDAKRKLGYDPTLINSADAAQIDTIFSGVQGGEFNPEFFFSSSSTKR